jgi:hypothetical protein
MLRRIGGYDVLKPARIMLRGKRISTEEANRRI